MSGIWDTDCEWYPPEQFIDGTAIDELSCVYVMGVTVFALFGDSKDRCIEKWTLSPALFDVVKKVVNEDLTFPALFQTGLQFSMYRR